MRTNKLFSAIFAAIFSAAFFVACNNGSDIGIAIIPDSSLIQVSTFDTVQINAYTYRVDSLRTSIASKVILGNYIDPVFGKTKSSFVTQFIPTSTFNFGTNPKADSMFLYLRYNRDTVGRYYGKLDVTMDFKAYEIHKELFHDSSYYSNFNPDLLNVGNQLIDSKFIAPGSLKDTLIKLPINIDFAQKLIDEYDQWHDTSVTASQAFFNYFNGLYIKSNDVANDGALTPFDLFDQDTKLVMHFHNNTDTLAFYFDITSTCVHFNMYQHQFDAPGFLPDLDSPESKQDSVIYLQGLAGLKSKILIPGLDSLKKLGIWGVNRAELVLPSAKEYVSQENIYPAPSSLVILAITSTGELQFLNEYTSNKGYTGVPYTDNNHYTFDITYRVQQILNGTVENYGFFIFAKNDYFDPSRVVINSPSNTNKMKLILSLRKLD